MLASCGKSHKPPAPHLPGSLSPPQTSAVRWHFTSNSIDCKNRVTTIDPISRCKPHGPPVSTLRSPPLRRMSARLAPIAMRIPISLVLWLNVYAITP